MAVFNNPVQYNICNPCVLCNPCASQVVPQPQDSIFDDTFDNTFN